MQHPNDTLLYVATRDGGTVMEINGRTMTTLRTFTLGGRTQGMALSPDRQELYVANEITRRGRVVLIGRASRTVLKTIVTQGVPRQIAVDAAGQLVIVPNEAGWVDLLR